MHVQGMTVVVHRDIRTHPMGLDGIITQETVNLTVRMALIYYMLYLTLLHM